MLRTSSGIVLGYVIFAGSALLLFHVAKVDPHSPSSLGFMSLAVVYGFSFALLAGFIAGRVGGRHDLLSGIFLAGVIGLGAIISMISRPGAGALWTQIAALVFFVPACAAGDWIRKKTCRPLGP